MGTNVIWTGTDGDDTFSSGDGNDKLYGLGGNDTLDAGDGNDQVRGRGGADMITLGDGNDFANGGNGRDSIYGGDGNDTLAGGAGADYIDGGAGNDWLGAGKADGKTGCRNFDTLVDTDGNNTFVAGFSTHIELGADHVGHDTLLALMTAPAGAAAVVNGFNNSLDSFGDGAVYNDNGTVTLGNVTFSSGDGHSLAPHS